MSLGNGIPTFRDNIVSQDTTLPRNVGILLPSDVVWTLRSLETSGSDYLVTKVERQRIFGHVENYVFLHSFRRLTNLNFQKNDTHLHLENVLAQLLNDRFRNKWMDT